MANNPNHMDNLTPFTKSNSDRAVIDLQKAGGIASGESRRLNKRLANLTKYTDRLSLTKHKSKLRKLWKVRRGFTKDDGKLVEGEDVREEITDIIENMRIIKDCGSDVLNIVAIANSPYLAVSKPEVVIKAQSELWDRREGKALAKTDMNIVNVNDDVRNSVLFTQSEVDKLDKEELKSLLKGNKKIVVCTDEELEAEEKRMFEEFEDE